MIVKQGAGSDDIEPDVWPSLDRKAVSTRRRQDIPAAHAGDEDLLGDPNTPEGLLFVTRLQPYSRGLGTV